MGRAYSADLRQRFVELLETGLNASAAGRQLLVPRPTAIRWARIWREEERAAALPKGGDRRSARLEEHASVILAMVEAEPGIFLHEIVARMADKGVKTSRDAVRRLLARHKITHKKRRWLPPNASAKTSPRPVPNGTARCHSSTLASSSLSTKADLTPR